MFNCFNVFMKYFGQNYKTKVIHMLFMAFMSSLLEFISVVLVFPFILIMVNPGRVLNNPISIWVRDNLNIHGTTNTIIFIGCLIATIIIIKNLYSILITHWENKIISEWGLKIKEKFVNLILYSPYEADMIKGESNKIEKLTKDIDVVMEFYIFKTIFLVSNTFLIILIFAFLIYLLPLFTMIAISFFTIAGLIQSDFFRKYSEKIAIKKNQLTKGPYEEVMNSFNHIKDIKVNGCQKFFFNFYKNTSEKIMPYDEQIQLIPLIPQYIIEIIFIFTLIILCFGILSKHGENPTNIMISLGIVGITIYRLIPQIYKNQVYINYINLYSYKAKELIATYKEYEQYDYPEYKDTKEKISFQNNITIKNLFYSYDKKIDVLSDINVEIKKGEFIGVVGLSGAGKSTLIDCLLGLLEYQGQIYIDETPITTDNVQTFRNIIGYVPQKINTIQGDIYTNVAWGIERKDIDKEKVDDVLIKAQLYDQLKQTENGLGFELKPDGSGLSGGQMQRIGIARALYRDPEIIILDEATSNLDVKIENKLTEIISSIKGSKTIIAIAHRLSTLVNCDRIIYLKDGNLIDIGTFKELSEKHTDFEEIVKLSRIKLDE